MADDYIEQRLRAWGEWNARRESGAVGFPSQAPYTRMEARSGSCGGFSPEVDSDALETEAAVRELPDYLRDTVREIYAKPGTTEQKIKTLRCGRRTLYYRVEKAKQAIENWLMLRARKKKI